MNMKVQTAWTNLKTKPKPNRQTKQRCTADLFSQTQKPIYIIPAHQNKAHNQYFIMTGNPVSQKHMDLVRNETFYLLLLWSSRIFEPGGGL